MAEKILKIEEELRRLEGLRKVGTYSQWIAKIVQSAAEELKLLLGKKT